MSSLNSESLKYIDAIIRVASESYLGYAAFSCIVAAFCLYMLSVRREGMKPINLVAYVFTILFVGLVGYAGYQASQIVKTIYYAGRDEGNFNVGRFVKAGENTWDDWSLATVPLSPVSSSDQSPRNQINYHYSYKVDRKTETQLFLKGMDQGREGVIIEIDFENRQIFHIPDSTRVIPLYQIIAEK